MADSAHFFVVFQFGDIARVSFYADSTHPAELLSLNCSLGGNDDLFGGDGLVD